MFVYLLFRNLWPISVKISFKCEPPLQSKLYIKRDRYKHYAWRCSHETQAMQCWYIGTNLSLSTIISTGILVSKRTCSVSKYTKWETKGPVYLEEWKLSSFCHDLSISGSSSIFALLLFKLQCENILLWEKEATEKRLLDHIVHIHQIF